MARQQQQQQTGSTTGGRDREAAKGEPIPNQPQNRKDNP
jgi:hypothetical protein